MAEPERPDGPATDVGPPDGPVPAAERPDGPVTDVERPEGSLADVERPEGSVPDAERRQRIDRATRGAAAGLLCLEGLVVLLIPRAIAQTSTGLDATKTGLLVGLAVVLVGCGFLLRRPWGIAVGSVLQLLVLATVLLIPVLAIVVVFFLLIWWYLLRTRSQLLGSRPGWRMLVS